MRIQTQEYNEVAVVALQGELNIDAVEMFEDTLSQVISTGKKGIVLDMREVGFVDGPGLEKLLWARDYCHESDCQLKLAGLDENCKKILEITRLANEFDRHEELAEAVKSFV
jgi:anti-sigma B factor antagonist